MGPGGQGLEIDMDWTEQTGSSPRAHAQQGVVGAVSLMWPRVWTHRCSVQQGFWSAALVISTRQGSGQQLLRTTLSNLRVRKRGNRTKEKVGVQHGSMKAGWVRTSEFRKNWVSCLGHLVAE